MGTTKSIKQQIEEVESRYYDGYKGNAMRLVGIANRLLRDAIGDYLFLAYIEKQERDNPRPVYNLPEHLLK